MQNLGMKASLNCDFTTARTRVVDALKAEGFGVLTDIDVTKTLKEKLGVDTRQYEILGACNPPLAHKAMETYPDVGLFLPCNVILYSEGENTIVNIIDPMSMIEMMPDGGLDEVAIAAKLKLQRVYDMIQK